MHQTEKGVSIVTIVSRSNEEIRKAKPRILSQEAFAERFHLSLRTIQDQEQGRTVPDEPARVLLQIIERDPEAVQRALAAPLAS